MKRSLARRLVRGVLRLVAAVVVLAAVALGYLHTRWGKAFVRGRVETQLNAQSSAAYVSVEALDANHVVLSTSAPVATTPAAAPLRRGPAV